MEFYSGQELLEKCRAENKRLSDISWEYQAESRGLTLEQVEDEMKRSLFVMRNSVHQPLDDPKSSMGGLIGGEASLYRAYRRRGGTLLGPLASRACAHAMAVLEQNASMRVIVAAPTAGSSGVLPGVLLALEEERGISPEAMIRGLFCAGAVGMVFMKDASVSGAEAGCQAEVGVASSMAAAAATEIMGGDPEACLSAAAMAISNLLGLVCDPVAGLVEHPCQSRNAIGAANAIMCADIALSGVKNLIPFDEMVEAMYKVGKRMPFELRETALGGCAATETGMRLKKEIFGE